MNDRILEIARGAGLDVNADNEIGPALFGSVDEGYRKFAELIIQECMNQVRDQYLPVEDSMIGEPHWNGYVQCGVDSYVAIRQHFFGEDE